MPIRHHPFLFLFSRAQLIILSRVQKGPGADGGVVQKGSGADGRGGSWCRRVLGQEVAQRGGGGGGARGSQSCRHLQELSGMEIYERDKTP